jgi:virginiamycin B lyase
MRFPTPLLVAGLRAHPANQDPNRPTDHHEQASGARHPTRRWWAPTAVGATAIAMAVLATAAPALAAGDPTTAAAPTSGHVYWATIDLNGLPGTIGRANLNGTMVNQSFIPGATQPSGSQDVTVDATHIYWADDRAGTIGRANRDGTGVDPNFITGLLDKLTGQVPIVTIAATPGSVAVDAAHIYWTDYATGTIGRANLDGSRVNRKFITGADAPVGVAVDAGHVYWTNTQPGTIGRANVDGGGVNQNFIAGVGSVIPTGGVAVDAAHVYWTNGQTIGRANLDGTTADPTFITGAGVPGDVDVDAEHVYWSNQDTLTPTGQVSGIGRASLDGTRVNPTFITVPSTSLAQGVAVDHTATP